ncbi:MAG: MFS transporter [Castellaniella sp.]
MPQGKSHDQAHRTLMPQLLACVLVLVLAQVLMGALSLSALDSLEAENTADRVALVLRQEGAGVQAGLDLGKPLAQYFGLEKVLHTLQKRIPEMDGAAVVLPGGELLVHAGAAPPVASLLDVLQGRMSAGRTGVQQTPSGGLRILEPGAVQVAWPLAEPGRDRQGAIIVRASLENPARQDLLARNLHTLLACTGVALLVLILILGYPPVARRLMRHERVYRAVPIVVLLAAQLAYGALTMDSYRDVWLAVTQDNVGQLAQGVKRDLDKVLGYGVAVDRLVGIEDYMQRILHGLPVISGMQIQDAGRMPMAQAGVVGEEAALRLPLAAGGQGPVLGWLRIGLDEAQLRRGLRERVLDGGTVTLVAVIAALELLRLLNLMMGRKDAASDPVRGRSVSVRLARPLMFVFLFAWALPLSFLPVHARNLLAPDTAPELLPMLMAAPIAAEMACGLCMALLAGRMSDRGGWLRPVLAGLGLSILGSLACAFADSLAGFVAARALVGLGYGLSWMGLQALVVLASEPSRQGRNMANVFAGLFAGHLSGAAVGAMLMQQLGAQAVFQAGAVFFFVAATGIVWMARWLAPGPAVAPVMAKAQPVPEQKPAAPRLARLLFSRDFGLLLIASVMPFSVAQVGLLSYALPLVMESAGAPTASVGRVLMLYGLCIITFGPTMGRMADRSRHKKWWIVAAGLTGSAGLVAVGSLPGVPAAVIGVLCLAMAGCFAGGAQVAYMLALENVRRYGTVGSTSLMRAADKIGQMLGPLVVAALFAMASLPRGLLITGALYGLLTLVFMMGAPHSRPRPDSGAARAP